jgi:hypothetical protein
VSNLQQNDVLRLSNAYITYFFPIHRTLLAALNRGLCFFFAIQRTNRTSIIIYDAGLYDGSDIPRLFEKFGGKEVP